MKGLICIVCPQGCRLSVSEENGIYSVIGNRCPRGREYGVNEVTAPKRVLTTTAALKGGAIRRIPVKTAGAVPKESLFKCLEEINKITVEAGVKVGDIIISNVAGTGVDVVAARSMQKI